MPLWLAITASRLISPYRPGCSLCYIGWPRESWLWLAKCWPARLGWRNVGSWPRQCRSLSRGWPQWLCCGVICVFCAMRLALAKPPRRLRLALSLQPAASSLCCVISGWPGGGCRLFGLAASWNKNGGIGCVNNGYTGASRTPGWLAGALAVAGFPAGSLCGALK